MPSVFELLFCYGLCFGLMNKVEFLRKVSFFDRMLSCSYCTGFHAGWIGWTLIFAFRSLPKDLSEVLPVIFWAFSSAVFCYLADTLSQFIESRTPRED
jgi:hypothetical protein